MRISLVTLVVPDYDVAIDFYVRCCGFELVEDSPSTTNDGRPKRWVVVAPPGGGAGLLLAQAEGAAQASVIGQQAGGRVGFFLQVDDFGAQHRHMVDSGVEFLEAPRHEVYGTVAVFVDLVGNRWDLLGPPSA